MSVTKFAFLLPNPAGATINIFSLDSMLNTSSVWCLCLQHPSPCTYISGRRPQRHRTARVRSWVIDFSLWLSLTKYTRKKARSYRLCSSSPTPDCESLPYISPWTPHGWGVGHSSWGMTLLSSPLCWLENKSYPGISFKLCLCSFCLASLGRESQDFGQQPFWFGHCRSSCPEDKCSWVAVNSDVF